MSYNLLTQALPNHLLNNAPLVVICLLLVDSFHFIFARLLLPHLPPTTSAMYVLAVGTVEVALFMGIGNGIRLEVFRRHAWFFVIIGFLVAASTMLTYSSVEFIDPGTASLLGKMSTLFSLGLA
jgi:drug/metabolite transporter (DMT)-like permease